ncbi:MAG: bifunctional DNA-formamidopyrimidine glycosylase/DNA-(apurinic or apyrimidinic site) lyase [Lautropia sp.]|nr:bifunctional DNA-formamidopyrimidine glycosylase/DNA-(apurinic or apyrimidinic site) lyase [Lautropia sp.]
MPELPEVEIVGRGVSEAVAGRCLTAVVRRCERLRWPVLPDLWDRIVAAADGAAPVLQQVRRRGKYLLLGFPGSTLMIHLGMSGSLRHLPADRPPGKHDHLDLVFGGRLLRLHDPRRFGAVLWAEGEPVRVEREHPRLAGLGVEPLADEFDVEWLFAASRGRRVGLKQFLLAGRVVNGVGNIYASESLFRARLHPERLAGTLTMAECDRLVQAIRMTLLDAIAAGGSSLKDFVDSDGEVGYFQLQHRVYGRKGAPCSVCGTPIEAIRQQGRSTFFCPECQPPIG